ncbi:MAG: hypothetical protein QG657_4387 [Acidobacteriota bacterium]|nr:hypothetical protein [Acidobacteriota bacterium]
MTHLKRGPLPQSIKKRMIPLMISLVFILAFSTGLLANPGYKIISFKGTVKVKQNAKVSLLENQQLPTGLQKGDAVMVYPGAEIEVTFPTGDKKTFAGPFYSAIEALEKPPAQNRLSFFAGPSQWKRIEKIFDEEGEESAGTTKGTQEDSLNFYNEIKQGIATVTIEDKNLSPDKETEMKDILDTAASGFNAFPEEKQIVIRSLVYKAFGRYNTALDKVLSHYKGILHTKEKQPEREFLEDSLFNEFLPIVVKIHSPTSFSSNFKLWWAAFYSDGKDFKAINNTIDYSIYPQNIYKINDNSAIQPGAPSKGKAAGNHPYIFIVVSTDWEELERLDDIETAKKELQDISIKESQPGPVQGYGNVIIKISL